MGDYDKANYLVCFGLAPYSEEKLFDDLVECRIYSVSFDESLNKDVQENQMDIQYISVTGMHLRTVC